LTPAVDPDNARSAPRRGLSAGVLLCAVPLIGVLELVLHAKQMADVVPDGDWQLARDAVSAELHPDDLVVFAPFWADPLGRRSFGDAIATMKREGRSDEERFPRAWEVSIRGKHEPTLAGWKMLKEKKAGAITVTLLENPRHWPVVDDLVDRVTPERLSVSRVDASGEQACAFQHGVTAGGSTVVPQGLLTPADRFVCGSGGHVGVAVLHALDHHPRLCISASPIQNATLRLRFTGVTFGPSLHGHSGIQWVGERTPANEKISVAFSAFDRPLGTHYHKVGAGWVGFELPTPEIDGKTGDLVAEIAPAAQRQFCFEATTRRAPVAR
jgi:hypothetical protein